MIDRLVLIGKPTGMGEVVTTVLEAAGRSISFPTIPAAVQESSQADLIVVLQHWSDEYTAEEIRQLLEAYPLARIVVAQGTWCLSDRRTRQYWPAAVCVPVESAVSRIQKEIAVLAGQRPPLPLTAGLDEIFAFDHGRPD